MRVIGIDLSTFAIDFVSVPLDGTDPPMWERFPLTGTDAFDRARTVAQALPGAHSAYYDDVLAVGIEHPAGRHGVGPLLRVQGAVLACLAPRVLVQPWPPASWRKAVGLAGNASKADVFVESLALGSPWPPMPRGCAADEWPQDAHDAHLIALATRAAISTEQAA